MAAVKSDRIRQAIYDKYLLPIKNKSGKYIGIELEYPIINLTGKHVEIAVIQGLVKKLIREFSFEPIDYDNDGGIYAIEERVTGDNISFDYSYNTLEFSLGKTIDLFSAESRFANYYHAVQRYFSDYQYTLTGMGLNPNYANIDSTSLNVERYNMIQNFLESSEQYNSKNYYHNYPHFGAFACASQVQLDVDYVDLAMVLNTFSRLESIKGFLFANSPMMVDGRFFACSRDYLWEHSMYGYNPENTGMYKQDFQADTEIVNDIMKRSFFNVARNGRYIHFTPLTMEEYFNASSINGFHTINGKLYETEIIPELDDINYFRSYKYADLTFRGTIEFRSDCQQPISDTMTVAAFHLGAVSNIHRIAELLENDNVLFNNGNSLSQLRAISITTDLPEYVQLDKLRQLMIQVLSLIYDGLLLRKKGEERFLLPLFTRAERLENPGKVHLRMLSQEQSINDVCERYSLFEQALVR